jgi:hypothetical protein
MVEDDAFCTKTIQSPSKDSILVNEGGVKWLEAPEGKAVLEYNNGFTWSTTTGWKAINYSYTASNGEKLSLNTSAGPLILSLPQNPSQFDEIVLADHSASWGTNNAIVARNNSLIENLAENLILNTNWPNQIILRFEGATWRVYSIL